MSSICPIWLLESREGSMQKLHRLAISRYYRWKDALSQIRTLLLLCLPFPLLWTASSPKGSAGLMALPFLASMVHNIRQLTTALKQRIYPFCCKSARVLTSFLASCPSCPSAALGWLSGGGSTSRLCQLHASNPLHETSLCSVKGKEAEKGFEVWTNCVCTLFKLAALRIHRMRQGRLACVLCSLLIVGYRDTAVAKEAKKSVSALQNSAVFSMPRGLIHSSWM